MRQPKCRLRLLYLWSNCTKSSECKTFQSRGLPTVPKLLGGDVLRRRLRWHRFSGISSAIPLNGYIAISPSLSWVRCYKKSTLAQISEWGPPECSQTKASECRSICAFSFMIWLCVAGLQGQAFQTMHLLDQWASQSLTRERLEAYNLVHVSRADLPLARCGLQFIDGNASRSNFPPMDLTVSLWHMLSHHI